MSIDVNAQIAELRRQINELSAMRRFPISKKKLDEIEKTILELEREIYKLNRGDN